MKYFPERDNENIQDSKGNFIKVPENITTVWIDETHSADFKSYMNSKTIEDADFEIITPKQLTMLSETEKQFLTYTDNYGSHLPMLLMALQQSHGDVIELGSGEFSTSLLRKYCEENNRVFYSYDSKKDWAEKTGSIYIENWDKADIWKTCGLLFVDHAPGEHRWQAIKKMANLADIVVVHDSEEVGAGDYKLKNIWPLFQYRLNHNRLGPGAGTSSISNKVNLHVMEGDFFGFQFEVKR